MTKAASNASVYIVLGYSSNNREEGAWVTINSTLPNAWATLQDIIAAHKVETEDDAPVTVDVTPLDPDPAAEAVEVM